MAYSSLNDVESIARWLKSNRNLILKYDLSLVKSRYLNIENINALIGLQSITQLDISGTKFQDLSALLYFKNLQKLNISSTKITSKRLSSLGDISSLQSLNIANLGIRNLKPVTDNIKNLVELDISENNPIEDLEDLQKLEKLRSLNVSAIGLINFKKISKITKIEALNVSNNDLSDVTLNDVQDLVNLHNLKSLTVSQSKISDKFLNTYFYNISFQSNLTTFIDENILNRKSAEMKHLCHGQVNIFDEIENIGKVTSLKYLNLRGSWCNVSSTPPIKTGLTSTEFFSTLSNLEYLDISNTPVKDLTSLIALKNLKTLHLVRNDKDMDNDGISMTVQACLSQLGYQNPLNVECNKLDKGNREVKIFDKPGTYEFKVPENVYFVSAAGCSGGDGGQGGQGGRGGYAEHTSQYSWFPICSKRLAYGGSREFCIDSVIPSFGDIGKQGKSSGILNLFNTPQEVSDIDYNGFCMGGKTGIGGKSGGVATSWPESPRPQAPADGVDGVVRGVNKQFIQKENIPVKPGEILTIIVGSGGDGGSGTPGSKNAGCDWEYENKTQGQSSTDYAVCAANGKSGQSGENGTNGYMKIWYNAY